MKRLILKETLKDYPARLVCKNGNLKYVLINSNVLWRDGEFIHTRCFTKDITDIIKDKERLLQRIRELESPVALQKNKHT
jgi:hypothetical protein